MDRDFYLKEYLRCLMKRADEMISLPVTNVTEKAYLSFFETGDRLEYERQYFGRREFLTVFSLVCGLWDDLEYAGYNLNELYVNKCLETIEKILEEKTWVLPAHGSPEHVEGTRISIDLFAAETAGSIAEILWLIKDNRFIRHNSQKFARLEKKAISEIIARVINPFLQKTPCDWWEDAGMNWTSVCAGNIGIAAYYMKMADYKSISDNNFDLIIKRVCLSMECYLKSMAGDGICQEGVAYYNYGMEYYLAFLEILGNIGIKTDMKRYEKLFLFPQNMYLGMGNSVNFSDCRLKNKSKLGMMSYMSSINSNVKINADLQEFNTELLEILGGDECHRWLGAFRDYQWVKGYGKYLKTYEAKTEYFFYPESMWYVRKWENAGGFYVKGGHNGESHNHNDIGSFGLVVDGYEVLCDLGAGMYTKDYFSDKRYNILCNSSYGHNVPVIGGLCQKEGREFCADTFDGNENRVYIEYGRAYGFGNGRTVNRTISFLTDRLIQIDDVSASGELEENLILRIKPEIIENTVIVKAGVKTVRICFANSCVTMETQNHAEHDGTISKVYIIKGNMGQKTKESSEKITIEIL